MKDKKHIKSFNELIENLNISDVSYSDSVEKLISHINKYLLPKFKLVVKEISEQYVNVSRNTTNSTKAVVLYKISNDEVYTDWYYNEFNLEELNDWCYRNSFIDRDQEPSVSYEFNDISQKIKISLNNL